MEYLPLNPLSFIWNAKKLIFWISDPVIEAQFETPQNSHIFRLYNRFKTKPSFFLRKLIVQRVLREKL